MARFEVPDGWGVQAFRFTLDPTTEQAAALGRHFGARRKAYNWTVAALKADIAAWRETGAETDKPSLPVLRKRWNQAKGQVCVNAENGQPWWQECSKEAYADGIAGAVEAYWNWQASRAGTRAGRRQVTSALERGNPPPCGKSGNTTSSSFSASPAVRFTVAPQMLPSGATSSAHA